jgi:hypothetical protein
MLESFTGARETDREQRERQEQTIARVLQRLRELHAESTTDMTDEERIVDGMNNQIIGDVTREARQALIEKKAAELRGIGIRQGWDEEVQTAGRRRMERDVTEAMFKEHWYESTLSQPGYPIHSATSGASIFKYDLRLLMSQDPTPETLGCYAWMMFDVDGLRSFKDCTSHQHTTDFLRAIAKLLVDRDGDIRKRFASLGITVFPMATGGDEFELYLRSSKPLSSQCLVQLREGIQREVSHNAHLRSFLDYDDRTVLKKYGWPSVEQRAAFGRMDALQQAEVLARKRKELPDCFIPTMAGGALLLNEGILHAVDLDEFDLMGQEEDFLTLREKIVQSTIDLAKERQERAKKAEMARLRESDPRRHAWRLRNQENRIQEKTIRQLETELADTQRQLREALGRNGEAITRTEPLPAA